jgi:hypothetical protein
MSAKLGLLPVKQGQSEHPAVDERDVLQKIGKQRFANLMKAVTKDSSVLSCGHATYPAGYTRDDITFEDAHGKQQPVDLGGYEVHCIFLNDIEKFLQAGG